MGSANDEASALEKLHDPKFIIRRCVDAVKTEVHSDRITALGIFVGNSSRVKKPRFLLEVVKSAAAAATAAAPGSICEATFLTGSNAF